MPADYRNYRARAKERLEASIVLLDSDTKTHFAKLINAAPASQIRRICKTLNCRRLRKLLFLSIECIMKNEEKTTTVNDLISIINKTERGKKI
jgi:hypothetical protein